MSRANAFALLASAIVAVKSRIPCCNVPVCGSAESSETDSGMCHACAAHSKANAEQSPAHSFAWQTPHIRAIVDHSKYLVSFCFLFVCLLGSFVIANIWRQIFRTTHAYTNTHTHTHAHARTHTHIQRERICVGAQADGQREREREREREIDRERERERVCVCVCERHEEIIALRCVPFREGCKLATHTLNRHGVICSDAIVIKRHPPR